MRITQINDFLDKHTVEEIKELYETTGKLEGNPFSISDRGHCFAISTTYNGEEVVSLFKTNVFGNWYWKANIYNEKQMYGTHFGKNLFIFDDGYRLLIESDDVVHIANISVLFSKITTSGLYIPKAGYTIFLDEHGVKSVVYTTENKIYLLKYIDNKWTYTIEFTEEVMSKIFDTASVNITSSDLRAKYSVKLDDEQKTQLQHYADKLDLSVEDMVDTFFKILNKQN